MKSMKRCEKYEEPQKCEKYDEHDMFWKIGLAWSGVQIHEEPEKLWKICKASKGVKNERSMKWSEK